MRYEDIKYHTDRIDGEMSESQREFLFNLAKVTRVSLEIGSHKGLSAALVSLGMQSVGNKTAVHFCIDRFESILDTDSANTTNTYEEFNAAMSMIKDHNVVPVFGYSYELSVIRKIPDGLDWIYINNSDNKWESVYSDVLWYIGKVKTNGLVLYHNFELKTIKQGIEKAISDDLLEFVSGINELGVYRKK